MKTSEQLYDVVIYNIKSRVIDTIAGERMRSEEDEGHGFHTVEKRLDTVSPRLNDSYSVRAVEAGKFKKGDTLPEDYPYLP